MQLERNVDVYNGTGQGRFGSQDQGIFKKKITLKRTKHATNLSLKINMIFLNFVNLAPIFNFSGKKAIGNILDFYLFITRRQSA